MLVELCRSGGVIPKLGSCKMSASNLAQFELCISWTCLWNLEPARVSEPVKICCHPKDQVSPSNLLHIYCAQLCTGIQHQPPVRHSITIVRAGKGPQAVQEAPAATLELTDLKSTLQGHLSNQTISNSTKKWFWKSQIPGEIGWRSKKTNL